MTQRKKEKKVIPLRTYIRFIVISVLFIIAIFIILVTDVAKDNKYDFPFIKMIKNGEEVTRIYPATSFDTLVLDENPLTFNKAKELIDKPISHEQLSDYNFGEIDHYLKSGVYKVYDRFDNNYLNLYEKNKIIVGFTYKYIVDKNVKDKFPEREYVFQDIKRLKELMGKNYNIEVIDGSKNFVTTRKDHRIYVFTIITNDLSKDSLDEIANQNGQLSLYISVFNNMQSYDDIKLGIKN